MELNNIKDIWKQEEIAETPEISTEKQKEIHQPLDKIRNNMKMEFWFTIGFFPLLFLSFIPLINTPYKILILTMIIILSTILTWHYFSQFFKLYKKINTQSFKTYTNLLNLRYELVLNTELYKSYYISFLPILLCIYIGFFDAPIAGYSYFFFLIITTVISSFLMIFMGKIWLKEVYGKYVVQITDLVQELSDEKDDFKFNRNALSTKKKYKIFGKTKLFFERKFGKAGVIINTVFWWIVGFILLIIISSLLGYAIGFAFAKFNLMDIENAETLIK